MDVDFYNIYLKKKKLSSRSSYIQQLIILKLISCLKNIFVYPVYCCSHDTNIVSDSLLLLDEIVKCLKKHAVMRSYLDLANNAYIADANFH